MFRKSIFAIAVFLTSWSFVLPSKAQTVKNTSPNGQVKESLSLETELEVLTNAPRIEGSRIGVAAAPNPGYQPIAQAFKKVTGSGNSLVRQLKQLINRASPAGRLYLAAAIQRLDKVEGDRILTDLQSDSSIVTERSGCTGASYTVGNVAANLLKNGSVAIALP